MNLERALTVLKSPYVSEKSVGSVEDYPQYGFKVAIDATKIEIRRAVKQLFNVEVRSVNTSRVKGKEKRFKQRKGRLASWKKAYVLLAKGQSIDFEGLSKAKKEKA